MELVSKVVKFELNNVYRSKWVLLYSGFFFLLSYALFSLSGDSSKAVLSLLNTVVIIIPLVSIIFGTMYLYNSREYIEMILCQPIARKTLFVGLYFGTSIPLSSGFAAGVLIPFLLFSNISDQLNTVLLLVVIGVALTFIFIAVAFLISVKLIDKVKGLGFAILFWLILGVVYDGMILSLVYIFQDYPLEKTILAVSLFNPVDLGRILFLLKFDASAMMGYTGAVFQKFFGSSLGVLLSSASLILWIIVPLLWGMRSFNRKDL